MNSQKEACETVVQESCLRGLMMLKEAKVLTLGESTNPKARTTWPSFRVHFDDDGYVTYLNLGSFRLRKGIVGLDAFRMFSKLSTLSLAGTDSPLSDLKVILDLITSTIECLYLGGNGYQTPVTHVLAPWIVSAAQLVKLDLRYNDMDSSGLSSLCDGLVGSNVKSLYLEGNRISDLAALGKVLECNSCRIQELYLGSNRVHALGAKQLASCLITNRSLRKLYLESNNIGTEGALAFVIVLQKVAGEVALENLFVDNNNIDREA